ncbi:MAG: LptE family protein [Salibacteraceae bacterium]
MTLNRLAISVGALLILIASCKVNYSFTGASVSPGTKTISIATFPSYQAPLAPPSLSQSFTESLKDIFLRQTNLSLVKSNGDIIIEGEITGYQTRDEAVSGANVSTISRLTITVKLSYIDTKNEENSYEQVFSNFAQFDGTQTLSDVETQVIEEINEKLAQDIFNKSLGNW